MLKSGGLIIKKYLFILLIVSLLAGCQNEVRDNAIMQNSN
ncbi:lipoprotein [Paraliobacillus sp. X-1268]